MVVVLLGLSHRAHRGKEGPLSIGSEKKNRVGLLCQGKDNVGKLGPQKHNMRGKGLGLSRQGNDDSGRLGP